MHGRVFRRAAAAAFSLLFAASLAAFADTVPADGDALAGDQTTVRLPAAAPGEVIVRQVTMSLVCDGFPHATPNATIAVTFDGGSVPPGGAVEATDTSITVPANWAPNGCTSPPQRQPANAPSTVTLTMPSAADIPVDGGKDLEFTVMWSRSGSSGLTGMTVITFLVDVNTPPVLHLPGDMTVEATSAAGAVATFSATASDAQDASPPAVTCTPASGSTFALGPTTVTCKAKDSGGLTATDSFVVTVRDRTGPSIQTPGDRSVTTTDATGTVVTWPAVTATDLVDPSPTVVCDPPSGHHFDIGTTPVNCTAQDRYGNTSEASFNVTVTLVPAVTWTATWGEPVATGGSVFVANAGRNLPVKVRIFANGVEQTSGSGALAVATCGGANVGSMAMTWGGGRWNGSLDTTSFGGPGCYVVTASLDGHAAGSFRIDLRGADALAVTHPKNTKP